MRALKVVATGVLCAASLAAQDVEFFESKIRSSDLPSIAHV